MNFYGQDILLDKNLRPLVAANGELYLTSGNYAVVQDVILRLRTVLGNLFYDKEFGSELFSFLKSENIYEIKKQMKSEVLKTIRKDIRIDQASVVCIIKSSDNETVELEASFSIIDDSNVYNLVINIGQNDINVFVRDL